MFYKVPEIPLSDFNGGKMIYIVKKNKFLSPFLYFVLSWSIVFFLYSLYWSELLPKMVVQVGLFLSITVLVSFLFFIFIPKISFKFNVNIRKELKKLRLVFTLTIFLFIIETIFCRGFPLLNVLLGKYNYGVFGLPIIHVVYYVISSMYCAKAFLLFSLTKVKKFLFYTLMFLSPGILIITRSYILYNLVYIMIIYFSVVFVNYSFKKKIRITFLFLFIVLGVIFLFGVVGNIRSNASYDSTGSSYIHEIAKPSESFGDRNPIFLWFYCYVTTPLGNLINTIQNPIDKPFTEINDLNMLFSHFLPDIANKRLFSFSKEVNLIVPYFNVSTVYAPIYVSLGYTGMIISYIGTLLYIYIVYKLKRNDIYSFLSFVFLSTIIFFNMFTNMFNFMGLAPQLWISIFLLFKKDINKFFFRKKIL